MQEETFANQPLLYIDQPEGEQIQANMQAHYFTREFLDIEDVNGESDYMKEEIAEKIQDALTTKEHVPNIKYDIETKEGVYRGIINSYEEDKLYFIDESTEQEKTVPIPSINNIRAVGL